jgi:hypothetical protein
VKKEEDANGSQNDNEGGGSNTNDTNDTNGGASGSGSQNQSYALTINTSGSGSATVTKGGNAVSSGAELNEDDEVEISITPATGQVPTATVNGSEIELTENDGVYTGNFAMPGEATTLVINTGTTQSQGSPQGGDAPGEGD